MAELSWKRASEVQQDIILDDLTFYGFGIVRNLGALEQCPGPAIETYNNRITLEPSPSGGVNEYTARIICNGREDFESCVDCRLKGIMLFVNARRPLP